MNWFASQSELTRDSSFVGTIRCIFLKFHNDIGNIILLMKVFVKSFICVIYYLFF